MKRRSRGSALIVVLLLLIVMTMASFALMRASETSTLIAGNMASKQAAVQAGDVGLVAAEKVLRDVMAGIVPTKGYASATNTQITNKNFSDSTITWSDSVPLANNASYRYFIEQMTADYYRITVEVSHQKGSKNYFEALYSTQ